MPPIDEYWNCPKCGYGSKYPPKNGVVGPRISYDSKSGIITLLCMVCGYIELKRPLD